MIGRRAAALGLVGALTACGSGSAIRKAATTSRPAGPTRAHALARQNVATNPPTQTGRQECHLSALATRYYAGLASAGNEFGTITIWNVGATPCRFAEPIVVAGIDRTGRVVTQTKTYPGALDLVLTPRAKPPSEGGGMPPGEVVADLLMATAYRDDADSPNGLCTKHHTVVPAAWRMRLREGIRDVMNFDPAAGQPPGWSRLLTCHGEIDTPTRIT